MVGVAPLLVISIFLFVILFIFTFVLLAGVFLGFLEKKPFLKTIWVVVFVATVSSWFFWALVSLFASPHPIHSWFLWVGLCGVLSWFAMISAQGGVVSGRLKFIGHIAPIVVTLVLSVGIFYFMHLLISSNIVDSVRDIIRQGQANTGPHVPHHRAK